jgi:hypothetical protein
MPADGTQAGLLAALTLPVIDAFAEHRGGIVDAPFTRITLGKPWMDGGSFIANEPGHLEEGAIVSIQSHGKAYRLHIVQRSAA